MHGEVSDAEHVCGECHDIHREDWSKWENGSTEHATTPTSVSAA
jgi:hypothetical protein